MDDKLGKKAKLEQFWTNVSTRSKNEGLDCWKLLKESVLSKTYGPPIETGCTYKVLAYDLDNTVITTNSGKIISRDARDWRFNLPCVPRRINEALKDSGNKPIFVIFSNQLNLNSKVSERASFESKIDSVIAKLGISSKCPVVCLFATARDEHRKPCTGMWEILENDFLKSRECLINLNESFFVGDAAGRVTAWKPGKSADWSAVDRKFAINVGVQFYTPEEHFLNEPIVELFDLGRDPKTVSVKIVNDFSNENIEILQIKDVPLQMVLAVGSPASGKSTTFQRYFESKNFVRINRDILKTMPNCIKVVKAALGNNQSVYIDNINHTKESRAAFLEISEEFKIPVSCLHFDTEEWLCRHLNVYRSIITKSEPIPTVVFNSFRANYQPPTINEGFTSIYQIPFNAEFKNKKDLELFRKYLF